LFIYACERHEEKRTEREPREVDAAVMTTAAHDTPVTTEFVGQTQSSRQVEIRARVDGFLDKRVYTEGGMVKAGEVMFRMDPKPFQAQLNAAQGALAAQRARLQVARDNLARVKPLTAQNALSEKDLDDAIGQEQAAAAAVETAKAQVDQAKLNLGYTIITSPLKGLSSYARVQEGAYVNALNSLLTYVAQTDPIWINFSISENDVLRIRNETERGFYRLAKDGYEVEIVLADGSVYPKRGRITFANADYNPQTGTFLLRATLPNPEAVLRPGQFVRVIILGGVRPNAILVPQQAVLQGAKGHFVWVVDKEGKARIRYVQVGPWHGDQWFIDGGLSPGETVVVEGVMRLSEGIAVRIGEGGRPQ
jgi:membrane fusion protein (multidrug efflux system)